MKRNQQQQIARIQFRPEDGIILESAAAILRDAWQQRDARPQLLAPRGEDDAITWADVHANRRALVDFLRVSYAPRVNEVASIILMDRHGRLITVEEIGEGDASSVAIPHRRIAEIALRHNATGFVLHHNHPAGDCAPSPEDLRATANTAAAMLPLELILADHIVTALNGAQSIREYLATDNGKKPLPDEEKNNCWPAFRDNGRAP